MQENTHDIYNISKEDFDDIRINIKMPLKYYNMYSSFMQEKDTYSEELSNVLILSKPRELKLFFRNVNERLKYLLTEFKLCKEMPYNIVTKIVLEIDEFIKVNLTNARRYMKVETKYSFKDAGPLTENDL